MAADKARFVRAGSGRVMSVIEKSDMPATDITRRLQEGKYRDDCQVRQVVCELLG